MRATSDGSDRSAGSADAVISAIHAQRSASACDLVPPGPNVAELVRMADAANAVPDRGRLRPTRFLVIDKDARDALAVFFVRAAVTDDAAATPEAQQRERARAWNGPTLVALIARVGDIASIPVHEQWIAVGAAMRDFLLTASAMGYGVKIASSGRRVAPLLHGEFDLQHSERLCAFLSFGRRRIAPREREVGKELFDPTTGRLVAPHLSCFS